MTDTLDMIASGVGLFIVLPTALFVIFRHRNPLVAGVSVISGSIAILMGVFFLASRFEKRDGAIYLGSGLDIDQAFYLLAVVAGLTVPLWIIFPAIHFLLKRLGY